jgi:F-type H+-transporting ATPase subunit b
MLEFNLVTILAEILNFLVFAVALYFLLFKPVVKRMEARAENKEKLMEEAQHMRKDAEEKLTKIEARLADIDAEIEERLQEAYRQAQSERALLIDATHEEASKILKQAESEAAKQQQLEMKELQENLVDTILSISSQILTKTTPEVVHENLIEALTSEIWDLGKRDMRQVRTIRDSLSERTPTVFVNSAKDLTPEQQRSIIRTFSALADSNVNMEIEIEPDLIAGIRVRIGDLVVENSLEMELIELKTDVVSSLEKGIDADQG